MATNDLSEAHKNMVCLGFDCMRIALGMDPVNFGLDGVRALITQRIADREAARPSPTDKGGEANG
jgi:hypothetical protein